MQAFIVAHIFAAMALSCMYSAAKSYQGVATSHRKGYGDEIPDTTPTDRANEARRLRSVSGARLPDLFADHATQLHPTAGTDRYGPGHDST